jgi:hypothetical protein
MELTCVKSVATTNSRKGSVYPSHASFNTTIANHTQHAPIRTMAIELMAIDDGCEIAVTKDKRLLTLLRADDLGAGQLLDPPKPSAQSSFTSAQDLPKHDYIQHCADTSRTRREFQSLDQALQALGLNPTMACDGATISESTTVIRETDYLTELKTMYEDSQT